MVRRDDQRVRCFTRNGHDWTDRFPSIVDAAHRLNAQSFLIDGEAIIIGDDVTHDFHARRGRTGAQQQKWPLDAAASTATPVDITTLSRVFG